MALRITLFSKLLLGAAGITGLIFALTPSETARMKKVNWINKWGQENGECTIHMVWKSDTKTSYPPGNSIWDEKEHLDTMVDSLKPGSNKENDNKNACKDKKGKILRLSFDGNNTKLWSKGSDWD